MKMKICFLSLLYPYDYPRILHESQSLAEAGFEVVNLAPGEINEFVKNGVRNIIYRQAYGFRGRLVKAFHLYKKAVEIDADCYHCNGVEPWLIALIIKLFNHNKRVIFDVIEHYPSRFNEPHIPSWLKIIGKPIFLLVLKMLPRWTDYIIFAKRSLVSDFRRIDHKQSCIFHYSSLKFLSHYRNNDTSSAQLNFEGCKVAIHIGGLSRARGWPQLLKALAIMNNKHLVVLCFGEVYEGKEALFAEAQDLGVADRIYVQKSIAYEQMYAKLLKADVGLMLYQPGIQNHVYAFPIKMYDYMLAALPFVGPDFAVEVEPIVREENCGLLISTDKPHEIARALDWVCDNCELARDMGARGRQAVMEKYNWEREAQKLVCIYEKLTIDTGCEE